MDDSRRFMPNPPLATQNPLSLALSSQRRAFIAIGLFSAAINLLYLAPSIYMLQVYDRVLASRNDMTLLMISIIVLGLFVVMAMLELTRSQALVRIGNRLDQQLSGRVFTATFERALTRQPGSTGQTMSDLLSVRQFLTGNGVFAFFDAPWAPLYLIVIWLFHPWLGGVALAGALVLGVLAVLNEISTRKPLTESNAAAQQASSYAGNSLRNAEVLEAMGMMPAFRARWQAMQDKVLAYQSIASDRAGLITAMSKTLRLVLQSAALGVGAYLVIRDELTPGMMIAGSILTGRALAPVDLLIATWKPFGQARSAFQRLKALLDAHPERAQRLSLPRPRGELRVEQVVAAPPGSKVAVLRNVSLQAKPGEILSIIGPSASGKSTLARLLAGVWAPASGHVRLDGADVWDWDKAELGPWIGYMPQDVELFDGTIAENIARFGTLDSARIIDAATRAGMHEMILRLPHGYDTPIGPAGSALSGGQRQRVALARALYGNPSLLILDEPNASLDDVGESALLTALKSAREAGCCVIVISHRNSILAVTDKLLVLRDGQVNLFGPTAEVMARLAPAKPTPAVTVTRTTSSTATPGDTP